MECLNYSQLEALASTKVFLRRPFWEAHLNSCEKCQGKLKEIRENLSLEKELKGVENLFSK